MSAMQISGPESQEIHEEIEILNQLLSFNDARVLELGCGAADKTRQVAQSTDVAEIVATEVDPIAHQQNLQITDLAKVVFKSYGAEAIEEPDNSFDIVVMFKSLHHVPIQEMGAALKEIQRVLKPGGYAYISEPVFAGDFNEVVRIFHDEEAVRHAAFNAVEKAVNDNLLTLAEQKFFKNLVRLKAFAQFEKGILQATHTEHDVSAELSQQIKDKFESFRTAEGFIFEIPNRVDLLCKTN